MKTKLLFAAMLAAAPALACLPVSGDRIVARDLAIALPAFQSLPESTILGYAPIPGATRVFTVAELESIARSHRISLGAVSEVCFIVPQVDHLDEAAVLAAMRIGMPERSTVEIVELSKYPVPVGEVIFPIEGIEPPQPSDPAVQNWKGYIRYGMNRRMAVWARVRIAVERPVVVAKRALRQGETLTAASISVELQKGSLRPERFASAESEVIGRMLLRPIKMGDALPLAVLERPALVHRGDAVKVEVINGEARLQLSAIAETNAKEGEQIQLRNPASGRTFRARVETAERAVVIVSPSLLAEGGK